MKTSSKTFSESELGTQVTSGENIFANIQTNEKDQDPPNTEPLGEPVEETGDVKPIPSLGTEEETKSN